MIRNCFSKLLPIALLSIGLTALAHCQTAGPTGGQVTPPAKHAKHAKGAKGPIRIALDTVTLTADEKAKIKSLEKTRRESVKKYEAEHPGADIVDKAGHKANAEAAKQTLLTGIKGVLTPAQWDQFQTTLNSLKHKGKKKKAKPVPPVTNN
jgi:Spy/CpxP family protein refolding chaperone